MDGTQGEGYIVETIIYEGRRKRERERGVFECVGEFSIWTQSSILRTKYKQSPSP
jgi:hypothetical protein